LAVAITALLLFALPQSISADATGSIDATFNASPTKLSKKQLKKYKKKYGLPGIPAKVGSDITGTGTISGDTLNSVAQIEDLVIKIPHTIDKDNVEGLCTIEEAKRNDCDSEALLGTARFDLSTSVVPDAPPLTLDVKLYNDDGDSIVVFGEVKVLGFQGALPGTVKKTKSGATLTLDIGQLVRGVVNLGGTSIGSLGITVSSTISWSSTSVSKSWVFYNRCRKNKLPFSVQLILSTGAKLLSVEGDVKCKNSK